MRKIVFLAAAAVLLAATQAAAHVKLVGSDPPAGGQATAPRAITLAFNEKLVAAFSTFELSVGNGRKIPLKTRVAKDGKSIVGTPLGPLPAGAYKVTWRAASVDGHRVTGELTFKVR